jgi:molybdopterin molybdotransferase
VELIDLGAIPDQLEILEQTLLSASDQADVIITSGGVSVGEADFMKQLLEKHGQVLFWKIAMKPGRPLAYGKVGHAHYFGLPGNPVAVMVTFYQFVREALLHLMGKQNINPAPLFNVTCVSAIKKLTGRTEFQRGIVFADTDGMLKVKTTGAQGSAILSSMSLANCFIVLDETVGNIEPGNTVQVQMFEGVI